MFYIFNCDKGKTEEALHYFQKVLSPKCTSLDDKLLEVWIGNHIYQKGVIIEEIDVVLRMLQAEWHHLQSMMLNEDVLPFSEMVYSREVVNGTFFAILESLQLCDCYEQRERYAESVTKALNCFSNYVIPITKFQDEILIKIATSARNDSKCPMYQYFHSFLDIQFHLLALTYICKNPKEKFESRISIAVKDLIAIVKKRYIRSQNRDAFLCSCVKNFWLMLQLFTEKVGNDKDWFWTIFNSVVENEDPVFTLWLLRDISSLHSLNAMLVEEGNTCVRITPNYNLLEDKLKIILSNSGSEVLLECFKIVEPLLCDLWLKKARIEVFQIIWDHYSKRLNISNKKHPEKAVELNDIINTILCSPKDCHEDFQIFVGMLVVHLREYPSHWAKIKGRIYSQLGPNKIKDLNDAGIMHVMVLFLSLASVNFNELSKKVISYLESLPVEKMNSLQIWNVYTVFIIRHVREGRDIETAVSLMLRMLQDASNDKKSFFLIKDFVDNLEFIINRSTSYQLHQWRLIDTWLPKYLSTCYYSDLKTTLNVLLYVLDKVSDADCWPMWETVYKECVYSSLKQISSSPTAPDAVGKIVGKLCLLSPTITNDAFSVFSSETMTPKISCQFLSEVLTAFPNNFILSPVQESLVLQSWVKICLLSTDLCENLTENVLKLDCFPVALRSHIGTSRDPIYAFIEYLGSDVKQHLHSNSILKLCDTCFGNIDKWLGQYLASPEEESVVFRVYTCISLAFLHCGSLLYDRNKSTSSLTRLVQVMLLPTDFLVGKKAPHAFVLNAVKKTWHLFFEAIVKLNSVADTFLERTLRDLILKYVQYFSTLDSPLIKCLENSSTAPVILDKISNAYLKHPVRESDANTLKVLKILNDFVQSTTSLPLMRLVINKCLYGLFEVVIFHSQRNVALSLIKVLTSSPLYPQVKEDFSSAVTAVTEKHLAFNTVNYFQLMYILAKYVPADVRNVLGNVKQHISKVERMRGVGFDKNLRMQFEKLESAVMLPN